MECLFIRHGIAYEPSEWGGSEFDRPLTEKGRKRVHLAAAGLASMQVMPTHLLSSALARAKETAAIIRRVLCPAIEIQYVDELAVGSTSERLLAKLRTFASETVIICVGHEPLLGETAGVLLCGRPNHNFPMKKSSAALIVLPDHVKPGLGQLRWWMEPVQLRTIGKCLKKTGATVQQGKDD
jgi:phosphohistidine phosphatase